MSLQKKLSIPKGHMPHLDGLRAVAILGVLINHLYVEPNDLRFNFEFGALGVKLFFILSGYLITGILMESRRQAREEGVSKGHVVKQFYLRRFLRIFPVYYLTIAILALVGAGTVRDTWPWLATYMTNVRMGMNSDWMLPMTHGWSLAVEEQFYLFWPFLVLWTSDRWLLPMVTATIVVGSLFKLLAFKAGLNDFVLWFSTVSALDALGAGALLAVWQRGPLYLKGPAKQFIERLPSASIAAKPIVFWLGLASVVASYFFDSMNGISPLVEGLRIGGFSAIILHTSYGPKGPLGRGSLHPIMQNIGRLSYGIYVFHALVNFYLRPAFIAVLGKKTFTSSLALEMLEATLAVGITYLIASASFRFVEKPINDLKKRFPYLPAAVKRAKAAA